MDEKPYTLFMTNDYLAMVKAQCENCALYQDSRPMCRITIDYFKGRYAGKYVPAPWVFQNQKPVCKVLQPIIEKEIPSIFRGENQKTYLPVAIFKTGTEEENQALKTIFAYNPQKPKDKKCHY